MTWKTSNYQKLYNNKHKGSKNILIPLLIGLLCLFFAPILYANKIERVSFGALKNYQSGQKVKVFDRIVIKSKNKLHPYFLHEERFLVITLNTKEISKKAKGSLFQKYASLEDAYFRKNKNTHELVIKTKGTYKYKPKNLGQDKNKTFTYIIDIYPENKTNKLAIKKANKQRLVIKIQRSAQKSKVASHKPQAATKLKAQTKTKPFIIAVDAGHGGKDIGAVGLYNTIEKKITLEMAKRLVAELNTYPGIKGVLTRDTDKFLFLSQRRRIARAKKADVFISLHADYFMWSNKVKGAGIYMTSNKNLNNHLDKIIGNHNDKYEDKNISKKLIKNLSEKISNNNRDKSKVLANLVYKSLEGKVDMHKGIKKASFSVLRFIDKPSILVELGFISNPEDAKKLKDPKFKTTLIKRIASGLYRYFKYDRNHGDKAVDYVEVKKYKVKSGDSFSAIAYKFSSSIKKIKEYNNITRDIVYIGEVLKIPVFVNDEKIASLLTRK